MTSSRPPWLEPRTAYVHVPFCGHHCGYCDFAVAAGQDHLIELYLDALAMELATLREPRPVESLFIGGGTPTYLSPVQLDRLLSSLALWFRPDSPSFEFTVESTPESLDADRVHVLADHGVNRVSIGVQSFDPATLSALERQHGVTHIPRAVEAVRKRINALSFDLIFSAPGQTSTMWENDLTQSLSYDLDHISTYGLTYEKGTPLWKDRSRGLVRTVAEDDELAMYEFAIDRLTAAEFEHYEISNFAKTGKQSIHNRRYWANEAYYGFGVGAARYVDGVRELNVRNTQDYVRRVLSGESPTFQSERLADRDRAFETVATQLRRMEGIDRERFREQTGFDLDSLLGSRLDNLVQQGLLRSDAQGVRLTRTGKFVADGIIEDLLKANA